METDKKYQTQIDDDLEHWREREEEGFKEHCIGPVWASEDGEKPNDCSTDDWNHLSSATVMFNGPSVKLNNEDEQNQSMQKETN